MDTTEVCRYGSTQIPPDLELYRWTNGNGTPWKLIILYNRVTYKTSNTDHVGIGERRKNIKTGIVVKGPRDLGKGLEK